MILLCTLYIPAAVKPTTMLMIRRTPADYRFANAAPPRAGVFYYNCLLLLLLVIIIRTYYLLYYTTML